MRRLILLASLSLAVGLFASVELTRAETAPAAAKPAEVKLAPNETAIYVGDMHCANCAKKISGKLFRVKGVMKVRTNVKQHVAIITPQAKKEIDVKAAWKAVQGAGFEPTKMTGPAGTFVADEKTKEPAKAAESDVAKRS